MPECVGCYRIVVVRHHASAYLADKAAYIFVVVVGIKQCRTCICRKQVEIQELGIVDGTYTFYAFGEFAVHAHMRFVLEEITGQRRMLH